MTASSKKSGTSSWRGYVICRGGRLLVIDDPVNFFSGLSLGRSLRNTTGITLNCSFPCAKISWRGPSGDHDSLRQCLQSGFDPDCHFKGAFCSGGAEDGQPIAGKSERPELVGRRRRHRVLLSLLPHTRVGKRSSARAVFHPTPPWGSDNRSHHLPDRR